MKKFLAMLLCIATMLNLCVFFALADGESESESAVTIVSAELNKKGSKLTVTATVGESYLSENKGNTLYLIKLNAWEDVTSLAGKQPVDDVKLKKTAVTFKCEFSETDDRFCSYLVAAKEGDSYTALSEMRYVDNLAVLAANDQPYPVCSSKKGLVSEDDAQLLLTGSSHTVIRVNIDDYLLSASTTDSLSFVYGGMTYYLSQSALSDLDHRVRFYTDSGVNVFVQLSLSGRYRATDDRLNILYYSAAPDGAAGYALNTASQEAMGYYIAFIDFLTGRYAAPGGEFGHVGSWIVGVEADTNSLSNAAGDMWMNAYADSYGRMLRTTYAAAVSQWSETRVYVSISNSWDAHPNNSSSLYNAKLFLVSLAAVTKAEGDFGWRVAVSARASDPDLQTVWTDTGAADTDPAYITMKNLSVLTDALSKDNLSFGGEARRVAVTDFASPSNPAAPTDMTQAASYAYAYHVAAFNDSVDAFIYSVFMDETDKQYTYTAETESAEDGSSAELQTVTGTLCFGMTDSSGIEKPLYDLFCNIDSAMPADPEYKAGNASSFALSYIGISAWDELVTGYTAEKTENRNVIESLSVLSESIPAKLKSTELADFEKGNFNGFYQAAGGVYTELRTVENADGISSAMLYTGLTPDGGADNMGVACALNGLSSARAEYVSFDLFVEAPVDVTAVEIVFTLRSPADKENKEALYRATASVKPNEWQEITFKTGELLSVTDTLDTLGIWVSSYDGLDHDGSWALILDNVTAFGTKSSVFWKAVGIIFLVLVILFILLVAALFILRTINVRRIKKRRAEAARRRAAAARRARAQQQGNPGQPRQNIPPRAPGSNQ